MSYAGKTKTNSNGKSDYFVAVKELGNPLMCGAVDPDDPEKGLEALKTRLKEAGIDAIVESAAEQYANWKKSQK